MDAWSRRIVGYAIGRLIDARLTLAALATAIERRDPPAGCIHHSGLVICRRGLPVPSPRTRAGRLVGAARQPLRQRHDVELHEDAEGRGRLPRAFESEEDVARHLPRFIDSYNERRLHSALGYMSPNRFEEKQSGKPVKSAA